MTVVRTGDAIYHSKILSFYRKEPFSLEAVYAEPTKIPVSDPRIGEQLPLMSGGLYSQPCL